ncbi:MAG: competence/damage-inducible protein A [Candidatus Eisenbacteria bacterium]|nr:competence/damage-inducible protein A [Candidatus Eisenbacteria bacterium]
MNGEIITIGNEILIGETLDTNFTFIAKALRQVGVRVLWHTTVGDDGDKICEALRLAISRANIVVATGGLGPTPDDVTRKSLATVMDTQLVLNDEILERIKTRFMTRGLEMPPMNETQALVPRGATLIENKQGLAPGLFFEVGKARLFILPGVPFEMEQMMEDFVQPRLRELKLGTIEELTIRTTGIPESAIAERLKEFSGKIEGFPVSFLPSVDGVDLRVTMASLPGTDTEKIKEKIRSAAREKLGDLIYGEGKVRMEEVVGGILSRQKRRLAVAESCTGGLISSRVTFVPGSSDYFERSVVSYSNRAKVELLKVPEELIAQNGAVSDEVARSMAEGIRKEAGVDLGLSVTGIAGPAGGSEEKPVGLVFLAVSSIHETRSEKHIFSGERRNIQRRAAQAALDLLRRFLIS